MKFQIADFRFQILKSSAPQILSSPILSFRLRSHVFFRPVVVNCTAVPINPSAIHATGTQR